jgi:hypothetical protein
MREEDVGKLRHFAVPDRWKDSERHTAAAAEMAARTQK